MKVLFLCKANVSRSQMAAALYNHLTGTHDADSAGVDVDVPGETLAERKARLGASNVVELMEGLGLDVSHHKRTQLTREMLQRYDRIISMYDPQLAPDWLTGDPRYEYWDVADPTDMAATKLTHERVKTKVQQLIRSQQSATL